jgi:hypothetical protein
MGTDPEEFSEEETARRANAALRKALNTPHKPHKPTGKPEIAAKKNRRKLPVKGPRKHADV